MQAPVWIVLVPPCLTFLQGSRWHQAYLFAVLLAPLYGSLAAREALLLHPREQQLWSMQGRALA